jgi:uncharacterized coiled-coil protein SlyX
LISVAQLARRLAELEERVARLERRDGEIMTEVKRLRMPAIESMIRKDLDRLIRHAARELDARGRHGGLVPLPELRAAMPQVPRPDLDAALRELDRMRELELKVANDRSLVDDPAGGLEAPGRGLLYYVVVR